ncbi:MAG: ArnT family glycosyltransferase [Elusimicrobiota bacterium]
MPSPILRSEDVRRLAVLAAAWAGVFLIADPRGQFPLNDDFQYAECARRLLAGEGLHLPEWALSWASPHAFLGALMTAPWGASNQALRIWMLVLGFIGATGVYALACRWKAGPDSALLAGLVVAVSPLYAVLSASFHLDVTAAVFTLAAMGAFLLGRENDSVRWFAVSSLLIAVSGLTRQTGFLCAAGGIAALALDRTLTPRTAAAFLCPAILLGSGFWMWVRFGHGPTWAWESGHFSPDASWTHWLEPRMWMGIFQRVGESVQLGALFLFPLAILRKGDAFKRRPSRPEAAALVFISGFALIGWSSAHGLPLIQNTLNHSGLGVVTLTGSDDKPGGWWESPLLWHAAAFLALISSLVLVRAFAEVLRSPKGREIRAAALFVGMPYAAMLAMPVIYDRYLLVVLPFAAAAFAAGRAEKARQSRLAFAAATVLALFTTAGLTDYFAWNRARWAAGQEAVDHGVPPGKVENGFDWDGQFTLTRNLALLRARSPAAEIGMWDWQALNRVVAGTSFSSTPPNAGWVLIGRFPYSTPLTRDGGEVRLFADPALLGGLVLPVEPVRR